MPIPSFDELLATARRIGEQNSQAQDFNRGALIAKTVPEFVQNLLLTKPEDSKTYTAGLDTSTGTVTPYSSPQVSGRSLLERMMGVSGVAPSAPGSVPLEAGDVSKYAMAKALATEKEKTPVLIGVDEKGGGAKELYRGKPGETITSTVFNKEGANAAGTIPPDKAGLYTLANESMANISKAAKTLFPKGTTESFDRGIAASSNIFGSAAPFSERGQNVRRWLTSALAGRQLIQTGVAARPEETKALLDNFMAGATSDPKSAAKALEELSAFYRNYNETLVSRKAPINMETPTLDALTGQIRSNSNEPIVVQSEAEAEKLPKGTRFSLNGKTGTVR